MDQYVFYDNSRLLSIPGPGALVRLNNCASSKCISDALWMSYNGMDCKSPVAVLWDLP